MSAATGSSVNEPHRDRTFHVVALGVFVAALAFRFYRIDGQSLWSDEGTSVALALRDLPAITTGAALDIHPPLYYYILHFWMLALGSGEIAVRALSAILGAGVCLLTFVLGRGLFGLWAGAAAAILSIVSPLQVQYSQETRMYMLATFLALLTVLATLEAWSGDARRRTVWLAVWTVAAVGALYSHYFAATVLVAENLAVAVLLGWRWRAGDRAAALAGIPGWIVAQTVALACFAPWLVVMLQQWSNWPAVSEAFTAPELLGRAAVAFSAGLAVDPSGGVWTAALLTALVAAGVALRPLSRSQAGQPVGDLPALLPRLLAALYLVTPLAIMYLLSMRRPLYNAKFLLVAAPAYCLLAGAGISSLAHSVARWWPGSAIRLRAVVAGCLCAAAVAALLPSLGSYYHDPRFARDDYRGIVRTIVSLTRPGDAIVLNAPGQVDIFSYYYRGDMPVYPLPRQRPLDVADTAAQLATMAGKHGRIWTVLWGVAESDPQRIMETWLDGRAFKSSDRWYGNVRLALYAMPVEAAAVIPVGAPFSAGGTVIQLTGYSLSGAPASGGDILQVTLLWRASAPVDRRYKVFVHLLGPGGLLWGQRDSEPGGGLRPTNTWTAGETVPDRYGITVLPGTPPGTYQLEVGLYDLATGARLSVDPAYNAAAGDHLVIGPVSITRPPAPPDLAALDMPCAINADLLGGAMRLLGANVVQPGGFDPPQVVLFWQAGGKPPAELNVQFRATDRWDRVVWSALAPPVAGQYPPASWTGGEIVRDPHPLFLPALPPGSYRLELSVDGLRWLPLPDLVVK